MVRDIFGFQVSTPRSRQVKPFTIGYVYIRIYIYIWSNYRDLRRPHPKWCFRKGNLLFSWKSRLVKYYNLSRYIICVSIHLFYIHTPFIPHSFHKQFTLFFSSTRSNVFAELPLGQDDSMVNLLCFLVKIWSLEVFLHSKTSRFDAKKKTMESLCESLKRWQHTNEFVCRTSYFRNRGSFRDVRIFLVLGFNFSLGVNFNVN